jgi:dihydrolipoamide dehydrogenase
MMGQILPQEDEDVADRIKRSLEGLGVNVLTDSKVVRAIASDTGVEVEIETPNGVIEDRFEKVLVAVGRAPNTSDLNLEEIGVEADDSGFLKVNEKMETTVKNVYAVGDVTGKWMLAHVALKQGLTAAENIAGMKAKMDYEMIPRFVGLPEFAAVGINEKMARESNISYKVHKFPYLANSKAVIDGETDGFIKILTDHGGRIIGGCIVGKNAINLISELSVAVANGLTLKEITRAIHPHPTYSEIVWECAMGGEGKPIHY